jgi:hypothetical protein
MKVKLVFLERGLENFFGIKPECSDLYFCASTDGNNKTSHLLKHLMGGLGSWISTKDGLVGTITLERWLDVEGEAEEWLIKKVKEFEFLIEYNKPDVSLYGHNGTDS